MARPALRPRPDALGRRFERIACGLYFAPDDERALIAIQDRFPPSPCRRTRPHITLRGGSRPDRLEEAVARLADRATRLEPLDVELVRGVVGEDPALGMTVVLEVAPRPELLALEAEVASALAELLPLTGAPRPFVPHVTLYRREVTALNARARALGRSLALHRRARIDRLSLAGERDGAWYPILHAPLGVRGP